MNYKIILMIFIVIAACGVVSNNNSDNCDPNYSGTCVPHSYSDLDCPDIGTNNFRVIGYDKHGFDRDNDNIACEPKPF